MARLAVPLLVVCLLAGCGESPDPVGEGSRGAASPGVVLHPTAPLRTGAVGAAVAAASCVEGYDVTTIGHRAFAFDGTVTAIGPGRTDRAGSGALDTVAVTFAVHEWFTGGADGTVTVDLMAPDAGPVDGDVPAYEEGTRLLVSGEPRWGGAPLDDAIAWSCGGFTRYYEPAVAEEWRAGTT